MKVLKKVLIVGLLGMVSFANAGDSKVSFGAGKATLKLESHGLSLSHSAAEYRFGYTFDHVLDNGLFAGFGSSLAYSDGSTDIGTKSIDVKIATTNLDIRAGYKYKSLSAFAIGSGAYQYIDVSHEDLSGSDSGYGFGVGGGLEFAFSKNVSLEAVYKSYDMTGSDSTEYKYSTVNGSLKIKF